jgi:hypothetical protein
VAEGRAFKIFLRERRTDAANLLLIKNRKKF